MSEAVALGALPGGDLVVRGLADLAEGRGTPEAALIEIARTRLRALGLPVAPAAAPPARAPELRLYELLATRQPGADPYPLYCAWIEQLASFLQALTLVRERQ